MSLTRARSVHLPSSEAHERLRRTLSRKSLLGEGPITFEELLNNRASLLFFKRFCVEDMSTENLLFWLEVQDFRAIQADDYRIFLARKLYRKYIADGAPMGLGISAHLRGKIKHEVEDGKPTAYSFDEAVTYVYFTLRYDIFCRFVTSPHYEQLVDQKLEQLSVAKIEDFDLYRFLGAGGFGMVLLSRHRTTRKFYATKVIDKRIIISQNQVHAIFREKEVLASVEHPFVVAMRYAFQTPDHLCLVLDFVEGGNMYVDLMRGPYSHERAVYYAAQVVLALEHLHSLDILYRDLKPDNVLLSQDGSIKLADMGAARGIADDGNIAGESQSSAKTAKVVDPTRGRRMTITGTHGYRAPEVYERDYGKPSDWWNVGLLIVEMLTCNNPLRGENRKASEYLTRFKELVLPDTLRDDAQSVVHAFLRRNQSQRLGTPWSSQGETSADAVARIKAHRFFKDIDFHKLLSGEHHVPFKVKLELSSREPQRRESADTNQLDYFCQMVDYMKTSMDMRSTWLLKPEDQSIFEDFDFVSTKIFEDDTDGVEGRKLSAASLLPTLATGSRSSETRQGY